MNRRRGIRWHLFQAQLVSIVPIGLLAAALLYLHWGVQEHERERSQIESVRLLAATVDSSLDSTVERLSILARLWSSSSLDDEQIYAQAREALAANADWANILAIRADGRGVFRADASFGTLLPAGPPLDVWRPVISERLPVISDLFISPDRTVQTVAVGVPVVRAGHVSHVLIADLDLTWYDRLMTVPGQPPGAVAGLFDRNFDFVARSSEGPERRGQDPSQALVTDMKRRPEGLARYTNLNGTAVYTAWAFSRHGWGVGFATPTAPVDNAFWHHLALFGFLWAAAVGAGILYALWKARPIASALESLEDQAERFTRGQRLASVPDSRVDEVHRAIVALEKASELLQAATLERDRSLETEREGRTQAEAASHAKDEFLAMLSHELRNPLAAIWTAATIVRSDGPSRAQLEQAGRVIERQSRHLSHLLDDLLDVGRAMTGKITLERASVDLESAARHVVELLQTTGRLADRRVEYETTPVWVDGDPTRLEQILTNLIVNAATYTAPGGHIRVRVARDGADALLEISDDGRGIAPENLPRVFELFFQAESSADRAAGGLGIGLTLVQRLAKLHGGEVTAKSGGRGAGATFTVRLPAGPQPAQAAADSMPARGADSGAVLLAPGRTASSSS